jgi:hypothetical protein
MSVMSAAQAGQTPDTGQEILPRGPRLAASAADHDGIGAQAGPEEERSAQAGSTAPPSRGRRLRLVSTEVQVTQVRVAREVSTVPGGSARRVSVQRARAQRVTVRQTRVQPGGLRLTRRGRRVVTGFVMLVVIISAMLIWTSVAGGAQAPGPGASTRSVYQGMTQIVVQPGQTLWSIALAADPSADPWAVVQQITDANALNGAQIAAGQLLWVPRG